jgi:hypothetical protein
MEWAGSGAAHREPYLDCPVSTRRPNIRRLSNRLVVGKKPPLRRACTRNAASVTNIAYASPSVIPAPHIEETTCPAS